MAEDIAPELLEKVQSEYRKLRESDKELAQIRRRMEKGSADGKDLDAYAVREGELLAEALHRNVSGNVLPNGKMYFNIADRVLPPVLRDNYDNVSYMSQKIIQGMNEKAGLHINAQGPVLNDDRVNGLVNLAATADQYEDIRKSLEADVVNFSQSIGTDTVRRNADFQYQSGLSPKIHRTAESGCCKWCSGLSGTYDYASVKGAGNDVWQRHRDCRCVVEFDPGNGKRQNAHTKMWRTDRAVAAASRIKANEDFESEQKQLQQDRAAYVASAARVPDKMRKYIPAPEVRRQIIQEGINEKKPIFCEKTDDLYILANGLPPVPNYYTIVCHGDIYNVEFKGQEIDPETLCAIIGQRKDYEKGTDILLISCYSGTKQDGVAQYIANRMNVNVLAPDKKAIIDTTTGKYEIYSGSAGGVKDGSMLTFTPKPEG